MLRLILAFVDIALHRRGPEDLPASQFFLLLVVAASLSAQLVVTSIAEIAGQALVLGLLRTLVDLVFIWGVLRVSRRERRFNQTASAILGAYALLNVCAALLGLWNRALDAASDELTLPALLSFVLLVWAIDIAGFVMSRALDRPYALGVALMLGYFALTEYLTMAVFGNAV